MSLPTVTNNEFLFLPRSPTFTSFSDCMSCPLWCHKGPWDLLQVSNHPPPARYWLHLSPVSNMHKRSFAFIIPFKTDKASVLEGRLQTEGYICYVCRHLVTPHCSAGTVMDSLRKRAAVHHWTGFIFASLMKSPSTSSTGASLAETFSPKIFF